MDKCNITNTGLVIFANIICDNNIVVAIVPVVSGERRLVV